MRRAFIEMRAFTQRVDGEGRELLFLIQSELRVRLETAPVIPGTGGLRKLRVSDAGRRKGKRGGYRVLYLDLPEVGLTFLISLYNKNKKEDMSSDEKRVMRELVAILKREARSNAKN